MMKRENVHSAAAVLDEIKETKRLLGLFRDEKTVRTSLDDYVENKLFRHHFTGALREATHSLFVEHFERHLVSLETFLDMYGVE